MERCFSRDAPLKVMAVSVMLILWYIVFAYKVFSSIKFTFFLNLYLRIWFKCNLDSWLIILKRSLPTVQSMCTSVRWEILTDWNRSVLGNYFFPYNLLHPLILRSDQHLNSPYKISPESNIKVTRIKETITNY